MDFALSEEQEMIKKTARAFFQKECPELLVREIMDNEKGYSPEIWAKIAELGWLGLIYPEEYEGQGGSILDMCILYEEIGRAAFPSPHLSTVILSGRTILIAGSKEQKKKLLPAIAKGELILALALTEPDSAWDGRAWEAQGVTVSATAEGDNYVIDGTKVFVHDAHIADYILCVARTKNSSPPEDGITLFLIDTKSPGLTCTLLKTISGNYKQSEVIFNKVKVPKGNIIGELHGGWAYLEKVMKEGALMLCSEMVGISRKMREIAIDYAKTRVQFDLPIGINQYIQEHCVYLVREVDGSEWLTHKAAWMHSEGLPCDLEVALAKAWTSDAMEKAGWYAHQIFAGVSCVANQGIMPILSKNGKVAQYYLGDHSYYLEKIASELEKLPMPEKPKGKPRGLWKSGVKREPQWDIWKSVPEW